MFDGRKPYSRHTIEELHQAEANARTYLKEHGTEIAACLRAKVNLLEALFQRVADPDLEFHERLDTFGQIAETAQVIRGEAHEFLDLATGPMVARIVRTVPPRKPPIQS